MIFILPNYTENLLNLVIPVILCMSVLNNFITLVLSYIIFWWVRELQKITVKAWVIARMRVRVYFLSRGATPQLRLRSSRLTSRCPLPSKKIHLWVPSASSPRSTGKFYTPSFILGSELVISLLINRKSIRRMTRDTASFMRKRFRKWKKNAAKSYLLCKT